MFEINKIHQGDCMKLMQEIPDGCIDMVLTDIPYGEVNRESNGLRNLNKEQADILIFDLNIFLHSLLRVCSGSYYIFCGIEQVSLIRRFFVCHGLSTRLCIWEKTNPSPMNGQHLWLSGVECCVYGKKKKASFNEHCKNTVWRFPNGRGKQHPTEKPIKLFEYLVGVSSNANKGDIILDPCMGSGTTAIACINTNRNFIGIEKEQKYVDIANRRVLDAIKTLPS